MLKWECPAGYISIRGMSLYKWECPAILLGIYLFNVHYFKLLRVIRYLHIINLSYSLIIVQYLFGNVTMDGLSIQQYFQLYARIKSEPTAYEADVTTPV